MAAVLPIRAAHRGQRRRLPGFPGRGCGKRREPGPNLRAAHPVHRLVCRKREIIHAFCLPDRCAHAARLSTQPCRRAGPPDPLRTVLSHDGRLDRRKHRNAGAGRRPASGSYRRVGAVCLRFSAVLAHVQPGKPRHPGSLAPAFALAARRAGGALPAHPGQTGPSPVGAAPQPSGDPPDVHAGNRQFGPGSG